MPIKMDTWWEICPLSQHAVCDDLEWPWKVISAIANYWTVNIYKVLHISICST